MTFENLCNLKVEKELVDLVCLSYINPIFTFEMQQRSLDKGKLVNWNGKRVNKLKRNSVVLARDNKRKWTQSVLLNKQQKFCIKWVDHFNILFKYNKRRVWNTVIVLI